MASAVEQKQERRALDEPAVLRRGEIAPKGVEYVWRSFNQERQTHIGSSLTAKSSSSATPEVTCLPVYQSILSDEAWEAVSPESSLPSQMTSLSKRLRRNASYITTIHLADMGAAVLDSIGRVWLGGEWSSQRQMSPLIFFDRSGIHRVAVKSIACGSTHLLMNSVSGELWAWGASDFGALGVQHSTALAEPLRVELRKVSAIACTSDASFALVSGTLYSWGRIRELGRLPSTVGTDAGCCVPQPIEFDGDSPVKALSCGLRFTMVLKKNGQLFAFGCNELGQCGAGDSDWVELPQRVHTSSLQRLASQSGSQISSQAFLRDASSDVFADVLPSFVSVACGPYHAVAVSAGATVWGCGWNKFGMLGTGHQQNITVLEKIFCAGDISPDATVSTAQCMTDATLLELSNGDLFVAGRLRECFKGNTTNDGTTPWTLKSSRFTDVSATSMLCNGVMLFAGKRSSQRTSLIPRHGSVATCFNSAGSLCFTTFSRLKKRETSIETG